MLEEYYHHLGRTSPLGTPSLPPPAPSEALGASGDRLLKARSSAIEGDHAWCGHPRRMSPGPFASYHMARFYSGAASAGGFCTRGFKPRADIKPVKLRVTRGKYGAVSDFMAGDAGLATIVGPTGCGKSTFALLPLFRSMTVLIVCPTAANAANILTEFNNRMPPVARAFAMKDPVPKACYYTFSRSVDAPTPLTVCTATDFVRFVELFKAFPPADCVVVDEYHLNTEHVVIARNLLTELECVGLPQRVVLVSATPPDEPPPKPNLGDVTVINHPAVDLLAPHPDGILRQTKLRRYGNNYLLIVASSCTTAHGLRDNLLALGESVFCLCAHADVSDVWADLRGHVHDHTVIVTPETEAGITVPASYMTNCGSTDLIRCENGVIYPLETGLGPAANVQRIGRAGRVSHTLVYQCAALVPPGNDNASPLHATMAHLHCRRLSGTALRTPDGLSAMATYPRLATVKALGAGGALAAVSPVAEMFACDSAGVRYSEYGGTSTTLVADNASSYTFYYWKDGCLFAPFLDLSSDVSPESYCPASATNAIAEHLLLGIKDAPPASSMLDDDEVDFVPLTPLVWEALKTFGGGRGGLNTGNPGKFETALGMLGDIGVKLLAKCPAITVSCRKSQSGDRTNVINFFAYGTDSFEADITSAWKRANPDDPNSGWCPDPDKVRAALDVALRPAYATTFARKSGRGFALRSLAHVRGRTPNPWFNNLNV